MDKLFKIGQAAKALGVSPSTLRRWEREGKITPERTEGSHRLYRLSQFKISKKLKEFIGKKEGKEVKKMEIENGELKVTF